MVLNFKDYLYNADDIDFNSLGEISESHQYSNAIASVMDKLTFYAKRTHALENSSLNESAKRAYGKDIRFNRDEQVAVACIFNEMLTQYEATMQDELTIYEEVINQCSVLEEGVEYDIDDFVDNILNEKFGEKGKAFREKFKELFKKGKEGVENAAKSVIDGAKDLTVKGVEVVKAKKDDLKKWAEEAKKEYEEKYAKFKVLIKDIIKKGIDSVEKFINKILNVFTSLGDTLVDAIEKLGALKLDEDEKIAYLDDDIDTDGLYKNMHSDGERAFFNNIIIRVKAILSKDEQNATKLMTESYLEESIVDNKFIAWLAGYRQDGTKMSWWKCILIGICASLIVWMLPKVLVIAGIGGALALFITALVGVVWNTTGILKLIYRRNKERKPGEKFFDKKTAIFFALSIFATIFSLATFIKTIAPLLQEICNAMGWTGGDDMSKFGEFVYNVTRKISPKDCFVEGGLKEVTEEVQNYGGDFRSADLLKSKDDMVNAIKEMPGASEENIKAFDEFLSAPMDAKNTSGVYDALNAFKDNKDLPLTAVFDTSKWGGTGPIRKAIEFYKDQLPASATLGVVGSKVAQEASNGQSGFAACLTGLSKDQMNMIFDKAAEIAGKDASTLHLNFFGTGNIASTITTTETIKGMFEVITPDAEFIPMVMPFFDDKKWGEYKIRFASSTRGSAAYVVDKVEMVKKEDLPTENVGKALPTLIELHDKSWNEYKSLDEKVNEAKKEKEVEEPQFIVFYMKPNAETGNEDDKPKGDKSEEKSAIGIVIDTLTMMCCDVCNFGEGTSAEIRRRPQPYFMKGLLSRISFRPTKDKDNDTKEYIRQTLGQTMKTIITQCVLYGVGKKYIDSTIDKDKAEYTLRETVLGGDRRISPDKDMFELGNFSPNELFRCLSDKSSSNKISYDYLDGKYASKVSIKKDKNGDIKGTALKDTSTIENVRYYRVKKEVYKETMDKYEKKNKAFKEGKLDKKPAKPTFIKGDDGEYYKRVSKKVINNPENKRKRTYDFVDIRIIPLLKKGELYRTLVDDSKFKKVLYKEDEVNNVKLNKEVVKVLKPFLFRPEKTFAKDDEYQLSQLLKEQGVEGEHLGWFKNLFKDEEQLHDVFKDLVETIWDYLSENRRKVWKKKDLKKNNGPTNEEYEVIDYTVFDEILEDFFNDDYDEETEYEYDIEILKEEKEVLSFEDYLSELE